MSQNGPLPYLSFAGIEVANAARVLSYLRNGLGNSMQGHWELSNTDVASVLYRLNGGTCLSPDVFRSPALDPAPWYDPTEPGSATFLGMVLMPYSGYDGQVKRNVTQRMGGLGGGVASAQYRQPRTWTFKGVLVSADDAGAEFGLRWLTSVLETGDCDTCLTSSMIVRLVSPPDDCSDDTLGEWFAYQSVLTAGPTETDAASPPAMGGCRDWVDVEFTIVSANPYLYKRPEVCLEAQPLDTCDTGPCTDICTFLSGAGTAPCCTIEPPLRGTLGAIFTLAAGPTGYGQVELQMRANCGDLTSLKSLRLTGIPENSTVEVNCATHTITVAAADGTITDGQYLIDLDPGQTVEWIEIAYCDTAACICIDSLDSTPGDTAEVEISTQYREG